MKEQDIHEFLQKNPFFFGESKIIYYKHRLGEDFVTDFILCKEWNHGKEYTFVELEKPSMTLITLKSAFSSDFNKALKQILDWDNWLQNNQAYIQRRLPEFTTPNYWIIGGRSDSLHDDEKVYIKTFNRLCPSVKILTYDDLRKNAEDILARD